MPISDKKSCPSCGEQTEEWSHVCPNCEYAWPDPEPSKSDDAIPSAIRMLVIFIGFLVYILLACLLVPLFKGEFLHLDKFIWVIGLILYISYSGTYLYLSFSDRRIDKPLAGRTIKHILLATLFGTPIAFILWVILSAIFR